ncbi:hypothetical protein NJB18091_01360 [Mycobacterium marinum]|uniref:Uncharacterized protein n=1 Tax=Mycobacterium pseudoshottsii TaxID=265949 RepID=A0A9N7QQR3_9MYCO|nr:hypothetical protein MPSD_48020 [Mycobacterium pseudoshottsii JCM 15466]BDN84535.1 hypothetical protein NJB1907Z4_C47500 [Mycobacterium pseudoshottsii]GJO22472.1 hypothetical protein NJB1507_21660 [Mycobacterium marinum]GJO39689.1 hypothetical protein NJB1604_09030 [Mycobacterium marinum]GJP27385.1 hypothetical protein NJB18091_01360 [Mycobacterium marinum]
MDRQREWLGGRQPAAEFPVDQQRPHIAESHPQTNEIFDIDAAIAQRATVFIRLRDLGGEGDYAIEARDKIFRDHSHSQILALHLGAETTA